MRAAPLLFVVALGCTAKSPSPATNANPTAPDRPVDEASTPSDPPVSSPMALKVDLSELPETHEGELGALLGVDAVDPAAGSIPVRDDTMRGLIERFVRGSLLDHGLEQHGFYGKESYPRLAYWENVVVQLPDFVRYGTYPAYAGYSDLGDQRARMLAYVVYRLDRSPGHIRELFERYRGLVFGLISPDVYESSGLGRFTRGLLVSHDFITRHRDYPAVMETLDQRIREQDATDMFSGGRTAASYSVYAQLGLISPKIQAEFVKSGGYAPDDENTDVVWFSSFWLRRHREGNTQLVHEVLREIDQHYGRP